VALQVSHDAGLKHCAFRLLEGDVVVEPEPVSEPQPQVMQQLPARGWRGVVAVGTAGALTAAAVAGAMQMGFLPGSFLL
jgi:adenine/guanine phosphoribosyltransferase-like PRPP-binding protein